MEGQVGHLLDFAEDDMMILLDECEDTKGYLTYKHQSMLRLVRFIILIKKAVMQALGRKLWNH